MTPRLAAPLLALGLAFAAFTSHAAPQGAIGLQAPPAVDPQTSRVGVNGARAAAVADSLSTQLALSAGAVEANPLVTPTPMGLIALVAIKLGLIEYADTLEPAERHKVLRSSTAAWTGASVNNLVIAATANPVLAIGAGIATGYYMWSQAGDAPEAAGKPDPAFAGLYHGANGTEGELVLSRDGSFGVAGGSLPGLGSGGTWTATPKGLQFKGDAGVMTASVADGGVVLRGSDGQQALYVR